MPTARRGRAALHDAGSGYMMRYCLTQAGGEAIPGRRVAEMSNASREGQRDQLCALASPGRTLCICAYGSSCGLNRFAIHSSQL